MTSNGEYKNEPRPRLCHLRRWPNFVGYGFNLHCEKTKPGQYIGKVDPDSPAESAGLREYDRIIEVNFVPVGNENHKQVVSRIKEGVTRNGTKYPEEVILLVLDPDADAYYKNKSIVVRSSDSNVQKLETEIRDGIGLIYKSKYLFLFSFLNIIENGDQSPPSSNKSIGKTESPIIHKTPPRTIQNEFNREYKHVTDFTGPTVTHTTKVRIYIKTWFFFLLSNRYIIDIILIKCQIFFLTLSIICFGYNRLLIFSIVSYFFLIRSKEICLHLETILSLKTFKCN
jgi:hypothetical protein